MSAETNPNKVQSKPALSPTQIQTLIELVKKHPIIYQLNTRSRPEKFKYEKAWRAIATEMKKDVTLLKAQWRCHRDKYVKKRKLAKKLGVSLVDNPINFLDPIMCQKELLNSMSYKNIQLEDVPLSIPEHPSKRSEKKQKRDTSKRSEKKQNKNASKMSQKKEKKDASCMVTEDLVDATMLSQEMIDCILKDRNEEQIIGIEYDVQPIVNYVTSNIEGAILKQQLNELNVDLITPTYDIESSDVSNVNLIVVPPAESLLEPVEHGNISDFLSSFSPDSVVTSAPQYLETTSESNNNILSISDPQIIAETGPIELDLPAFNEEIQQDLGTVIEEDTNESNKSKAPDEVIDCVECRQVEGEKEKASILDVNCDETDLKVLFNELAEYVSNRFTLQKQMKIRFQICALVTKAELEELEESEINET